MESAAYQTSYVLETTISPPARALREDVPVIQDMYGIQTNAVSII